MVNRVQRATAADRVLQTRNRQVRNDESGSVDKGEFKKQLQATNPFSGAGTPVKPALSFTAPIAPPPPPMTDKPEGISLATTPDAAIYNSARSVQITNAKYNEQAYESYNKAVSEWQANNGRRWLGNNQFGQTSEPPPPPEYLPVDFGSIRADIAANYAQGRPMEDVYSKRPYYMGGAVFFASKTS